jgi:hypothetical protein
MNDHHQAAERRPEEYVLFALTFAGLGTAGGGIVLCLPGLALTGAMLSLLTLLAFLGRATPAD